MASFRFLPSKARVECFYELESGENVTTVTYTVVDPHGENHTVELAFPPDTALHTYRTIVEELEGLKKQMEGLGDAPL